MSEARGNVIKITAKALLAALVAAALVIPEPACAASMSNITATVYYTPVESYYPRKDLTTVRAWPNVRTVSSKVRVGPLPAAFVRHTRAEGTGKITSGKYAGRFLNWSYEGLGPNENQEGFWIDTCPRNAYGGCLKKRVTSAAVRSLGIKRGTQFKLVTCGSEKGSPACAYFKQGNWVVKDRFTTGIASDRQIDLYYGLQNFKGFRQSDYWITMRGAKINVRS
jgi:hypothetical protein